MERKKKQRSGSFCEVEGDMKAGRLSAQLPKRSSSFRSCLKKPLSEKLEEPSSTSSSRRSSGSKAVMFTDEVGESLVEVKKFVETEPLKTGENENTEFTNNRNVNDVPTLNNVENVHYIDALSDYYEHAPKKKNSQNTVFGNPNIKKSQSFAHAKRPEIQKTADAPQCPPSSPLTSPVTSSPLCSPNINTKNECFEFPTTRGIKKSRSFGTKMSPIAEGKSPLILSFQRPHRKITPPQPTIILTSPMEEKENPLNNQQKEKVEQLGETVKAEIQKSKLCGMGEKLSENLIKEGLETYRTIQRYTAKDSYRNLIKENLCVSKINIEQDTQPSRPERKSSSTCQPPPPPSSAPPPLPSL